MDNKAQAKFSCVTDLTCVAIYDGMRYAEIQVALKEAVGARGTNPYRAAMEAGLPGTAIRRALEGHEPKAGRLIEICDALDLEFYIGPPRGAVSAEPADIAPLPAIPQAITDMPGLPEDADADAVVRAMEAKIAGRGTPHAISAAALDRRAMRQMLKSETRALRDELAAMLDARLPPPDAGAPEAGEIRKLILRQAPDVRAAGGVGEEIFDEAATGTVMIAADDLPPNLDTDRLVAIRAAGRSMEPTIRDEDILVLDPDATEPREGSVFVIRTDTGLVVKRLRQEGGAWIMTSDTPDREPRPVTGQDRIVGHVVWFGPEGAIVTGE